MRRRRILLLNALAFLLPALALAETQTYDVVVYGGTSAGVTAAVQAARMGHRVVLVEPGAHLGGLSSGGLGQTDSGDAATIGGLASEFYRRVHDHYENDGAWIHEIAEHYGAYRPGAETMWRFEPHVAESIFEAMVAESGVAVARDAGLDREAGVQIDDGRIVGMTTRDGRTYRGEVFIDATYEGDLMAAAGVSYTVGRESNATYDETLNGVQVASTNRRTGKHFKPVDPYRIPGEVSSGLVWGVHDGGPGRDGQADEHVQAYCFRMCLTDVAENQVPFPKPPGYDPARYELLLRRFEVGQDWVPWINSPMPNRKTDTNNHGYALMSSDYIGGNVGYPDADDATREAIIADHESYQKGLMWTLANHPRVPQKIRESVNRWGLAKDEFQDNEHWPHQLYVREARRMIGAYVMTEHDCLRQRPTPRPIGLGSYALDSHHVQRYVTAQGSARNEGNTYRSTGGAYQISYDALTPRADECTNLLVPVCASTSHIAYGSIRMEPVFMILGQSAGAAAVEAIDDGVNVQRIDYKRLRARLLDDGQVIDLPRSSQLKRVVNAAELPGVVVDDADAELIGSWRENNVSLPYVQSGYQHDDDTNKGECQAIFRAELPPGKYEVRIAYSAHKNRATRVPVAVSHVDESETRYVNQTRTPEIDNLFTSLGVFYFSDDAAVTIGNQATRGHVMIDAVQFLPRSEDELN